MTITLTGQIVAIMAIVAILILGLIFNGYRQTVNSILKEQNRQLIDLKQKVKTWKDDYERKIELAHMTTDIWKKCYEKKVEELEKYKKAEEARKLDEKMLLPKQDDNSTKQDLEF